MIKKLASFLLVINCFLLIGSAKKIERRSVSAILSSIPWIESRPGTPEAQLLSVDKKQIQSPLAPIDNEQTHFYSINVCSQK